MALARAQHDTDESAGISGRTLCWHGVHVPAAGVALDRLHESEPTTHAGSHEQQAAVSTKAVSDCTAAVSTTSVVVPVGIVSDGGKHGTPQWAQAAPSRKWMQGWRAPGTVPSTQQECAAAHPSTCHRDDASANTWGSQSLSSNSGASAHSFQRCEGRRASVGRASLRTGRNDTVGTSWSSLLPIARQALAPLPSEVTGGPEPAEAAEDSDEGAEHGELGIGHSAARMERGSKRARGSSGCHRSATQQRRRAEYHSPRSSCEGGHGGAAGRGSGGAGRGSSDGSGSGAGSDGNEGSESPHNSHSLTWLGPGNSAPPAGVNTHGGLQAAGMTTLTVTDQSAPPTVATSDLHRTGTAHSSFRAGSSRFTRPHVLSATAGAAMPRVTVAMWDDVVDRHVADDVARGSDMEDEAPWSPNFARLKRTATCSKRCASRVKRVLKRTWGGLLPGNMESRAIYEQFKWAPVWLSMMLLLVPLSLDGETLDKWMFALVFHAAYLWMSLAFGFTSFALLYPLPPTRHLVMCVAATTLVYLPFVALAITYLSGRTLLYVLPIALMLVVSMDVLFLFHSAVTTCLVPVVQQGLRTPSTWGILTGRIQVHTRKKPVVGPGSNAPDTAAAGTTREFVLNADALLPFRRLLVAFTLIAISFYWFQVYTTTLAFDMNTLMHEKGVDTHEFGVMTILVFELVLFGFRCLMRTVMNPTSLVQVGIPETSARAVSTCMTYAVVIRGLVFERLLFMNFKSTESLEVAVLQRTALHIGVDLVTMTPWYHRLRSKAFVATYKCVFPSRPAIKMRNFKEYLFDQQSINMFAHIANFTSLATWVLALVWFRFGYNAPVFPFGSGESSDEQFWRLLQYGGILALAEFGELLFIRVLAVCRGDRVRYFERALRHMRHPSARLAFIVIAAHMLQDAMVALVRVEPA